MKQTSAEQPMSPDHGRSGPRPSRVLIGPDGLRAGWSLLLFAVLLAVLGVRVPLPTDWLHHPHRPLKAEAGQITASPSPSTPTQTLISPQIMILAEGSSFLVVLFATFVLGQVERRPFRVYGLGGAHRMAQFSQGLAWGASLLSLLVLALRLSGYLCFDGLLLRPAEAVRAGMEWAFGFLMVACLEDFLTRGFLQYTLARGLAGVYGLFFRTPSRHALWFWTAAAVLSFLFGAGHSANPGESPIGLLSAGLAGLLFCFALYRTGSLWWAIGFHASWDWAQSFLYGVPDSGTMVERHLFATHPIGTPILSGGATGPEGSIFILPVLAIAAAVVYFTLPAVPRPLDAPARSSSVRREAKPPPSLR